MYSWAILILKSTIEILFKVQSNKLLLFTWKGSRFWYQTEHPLTIFPRISGWQLKAGPRTHYFHEARTRSPIYKYILTRPGNRAGTVWIHLWRRWYVPLGRNWSGLWVLRSGKWMGEVVVENGDEWKGQEEVVKWR